MSFLTFLIILVTLLYVVFASPLSPSEKKSHAGAKITSRRKPQATTLQKSKELLAPAERKGGGGRRGSRSKKPKRPKNPFDLDDDDDSDNEGSWTGSCFPSSAKLQTGVNTAISFSAAKVGTPSIQADGTSSPIVTFTHRLHNSFHTFVSLHTTNGSLDVSPGHLVHTQTGIKPAGHVTTSDSLVLASGALTPVQSKKKVLLRGLHNAHTLRGEMIVNGFRVSCYTHAVRPMVGEGLLAPVRAFYKVFGKDLTNGILHDGANQVMHFWGTLSSLR